MRRGEQFCAPADEALRSLVDAIVANDREMVSTILDTTPALATAKFQHGASRHVLPSPLAYFLPEIGHYINSGDTALHVAAAAHRSEMVSELIKLGAGVRAKNRRGTEPLHLAASGEPTSPTWDSLAQSATIVGLINAGADPNARNDDGTTPLHRAVRTRCADAVRTLLEYGADPSIPTKRGSTAKELAILTTGRPGSGSPEAKAQQAKILILLEGA